ncbi:MAG: helix-turn-helix domain-containing protein [Burkholderiaceae bacterium]
MRAIVGIHPANSASRVAGRSKAPMPTVWFASWRQLAGVLSDENRALLQLMNERRPATVSELASLSGRAPSNLSRTLRNLEGYGLVKLHRRPGTRAVRPEALATEFLVVLN